MTSEQRKALDMLVVAIQDTVNEAGEFGAPAGVVYTVLLQVWPNMTSTWFNQLISAMVDAGKIQRENHVLKPVQPVH